MLPNAEAKPPAVKGFVRPECMDDLDLAGRLRQGIQEADEEGFDEFGFNLFSAETGLL